MQSWYFHLDDEMRTLCQFRADAALRLNGACFARTFALFRDEYIAPILPPELAASLAATVDRPPGSDP
jgi:hypothetical protein